MTEAARNFADCVNRVHYQDVTFVLLKNGLPVAHLAPEKEKVCLGRDLAEALRESDLTAKEAKAWRRDLKNGRKGLEAPTDRWQ